MKEKDLLIKKLRFQISQMREIIHILDKNLSRAYKLYKRSTPDLPTIVFEDL